MVLAQGFSLEKEKEKEDSWNCQGGGIESFFSVHGFGSGIWAFWEAVCQL